MNTKITLQRRKELSGNFSRMFFIQAFQNIRTINVVVTLFYLSRGLHLTQVFYLSIIWSLINILFEVPSSYLADHWGRKKTIVLGVSLYVVSCLWLIFADSFLLISVSVFFYALSNACFTGTDDALIYDTNRELGTGDDSLRRFGQYYAAERIFKIVSPLIGVLIAKDLSPNQFVILLIIDASAAVISLLSALFIVEPKRHYIEVEKMEAGILRDAINLIKNNPNLMRAICNRALGFIGFFIIWRYQPELFTKLGAPILMLGFGWSILHLGLFISNYFIHKSWSNKSLTTKINFLNLLSIISIGLFLIGWHLNIPYYWLLFIYILGNFFENARWPIFADLFNKYSNSFNRATTLSLSNFVKSIFDLPLLALAGFLVTYGLVYPIYFTFIILLLSSIISYLPKKLKFENKY
ncbi:MAG: major facilitator transporter [uncultured bacterium]|nr:MAG: major facilitator transporter [uncultured bacterium]